MKLRPASTADAPSIASILSTWIDETDWMPRIHTHEEDRGFGAFLIEKTSVTVADDAGVVGFLALKGDDIEALYVAKDSRRVGVGSALIEAAKGHSENLSLWTFQANTEARKFYTKLGFAEGEKTDGAGNDEKLPDIFMTWTNGEKL